MTLWVVVFFISLCLNVHFCTKRHQGYIKDTTIYDTIPYFQPVPKDSIVIRYQNVKLPVISSNNNTDELHGASGSDTGIILDSVNVEVPITQKVYEDSLYRAYVSGYNPNLDSLILFPRTNLLTFATDGAKQKVKRWGIGIQVGYGVVLNRNPQLFPYIGVGVSYNLFNF